MNKKLLGIFFGNNALCLAEVEKRALRSFLEVPHGLFEESHAGLQHLPDEIKLTAIIQKSLRDQHIETMDTCLVLPNQDVLLRSFTIPWMTAAEVKGVVDFEARRYIPFRLEDLAYVYHTVQLIEKKTKSIRVLFVGIRKDVLEKYCLILQQAGLRITTIEPSSVSLLRLLTSGKHVLSHQKLAIIQVNKTDGTIIIADQTIPQFIRDFRIPTASSDTATLDTTIFKERLANETRISLDYYRRQNPQGQVDKILFISPHLTPDIGKSLEEALDMPVLCLQTQTLLNREEETSTEALSAFGGGLKDTISFLPSINLVKVSPKIIVAEKPLTTLKINYITSLKVAGVCALAAVLSILFINRDLFRYQRNLATLDQQQGIYKPLPEAELLKRKEETLSKLEQYKNIRLKSNVTFFLRKIPDLLPHGAWLSSLTISYADKTSLTASDLKIVTKKSLSSGSPITLDMLGYVFDVDANQQIKLVNDLMASLQNDDEFSRMFDTVDLRRAQKQNIDKNTLTSFQITCQ